MAQRERKRAFLLSCFSRRRITYIHISGRLLLLDGMPGALSSTWHANRPGGGTLLKSFVQPAMWRSRACLYDKMDFFGIRNRFEVCNESMKATIKGKQQVRQPPILTSDLPFNDGSQPES